MYARVYVSNCLLACLSVCLHLCLCLSELAERHVSHHRSFLSIQNTSLGVEGEGWGTGRVDDYRHITRGSFQGVFGRKRNCRIYTPINRFHPVPLVLGKCPDPLSGRVVRQTPSDVTTGQYLVSVGNPACAFSSDSPHCCTTVSDSGSGS